MDASGSGCCCHVSRSSFCSSSPPHVSRSLRLRSSPLCSYTLLFTTSRCQKAACLLERFPPPPVYLYFFFILSLSTSCLNLFISLSHTLLLWPHYFIYFFCHTLTSPHVCLLFLFSLFRLSCSSAF